MPVTRKDLAGRSARIHPISVPGFDEVLIREMSHAEVKEYLNRGQAMIKEDKRVPYEMLLAYCLAEPDGTRSFSKDEEILVSSLIPNHCTEFIHDAASRINGLNFKKKSPEETKAELVTEAKNSEATQTSS